MVERTKVRIPFTGQNRVLKTTINEWQRLQEKDPTLTFSGLSKSAEETASCSVEFLHVSRMRDHIAEMIQPYIDQMHNQAKKMTTMT